MWAGGQPLSGVLFKHLISQIKWLQQEFCPFCYSSPEQSASLTLLWDWMCECIYEDYLFCRAAPKIFTILIGLLILIKRFYKRKPYLHSPATSLGIYLRSVLQSQINIPRVSFRYLASLNLTKAIPLSSPTTLVINSISQPRVSQSSYERVHIKGRRLQHMTNRKHGLLAVYWQQSKEQTIILDNMKKLKNT